MYTPKINIVDVSDYCAQIKEEIAVWHEIRLRVAMRGVRTE